MEKIKDLLKKVKKDPEAQAKLADLTKPEDENGIIRYYAEAAKRLGFDITEADLREMIAAHTKERLEKSENAAEQINAVQDNELEMVAGGSAGKHEECMDTFQDGENCWSLDGCDVTISLYPNYSCQHNYYGHVCGDKESFDCSSFIF